jgi:hypothetical protein
MPDALVVGGREVCNVGLLEEPELLEVAFAAKENGVRHTETVMTTTAILSVKRGGSTQRETHQMIAGQQ